MQWSLIPVDVLYGDEVSLQEVEINTATVADISDNYSLCESDLVVAADDEPLSHIAHLEDHPALRSVDADPGDDSLPLVDVRTRKYWADRENDVNWNTLAMLAEKPGLNTPRHAAGAINVLSRPGLSFAAFLLLIHIADEEEEEARYSALTARRRPRTPPLMQQWLMADLRHEQWWL